MNHLILYRNQIVIVMCCGAKKARPLPAAEPGKVKGVYYAVDFLTRTHLEKFCFISAIVLIAFVHSFCGKLCPFAFRNAYIYGAPVGHRQIMTDSEINAFHMSCIYGYFPFRIAGHIDMNSIRFSDKLRIGIFCLRWNLLQSSYIQRFFNPLDFDPVMYEVNGICDSILLQIHGIAVRPVFKSSDFFTLFLLGMKCFQF